MSSYLRTMLVLGVGLVASLIAGGCGSSGMNYPHMVVREDGLPDGQTLLSLATSKDGAVDYQQLRDAFGRVTELRYRLPEGNSWWIVKLDAVDAATVPHLIIALDGTPYDFIERLYREEGLFRLFYRPSRVVSCSAGMTVLVGRRFNQNRLARQPVSRLPGVKKRLGDRTDRKNSACAVGASIKRCFTQRNKAGYSGSAAVEGGATGTSEFFALPPVPTAQVEKFQGLSVEMGMSAPYNFALP